ncbi:MAG: hypothetical protein HY327_04105 [Chloroflexi bacterium]|nr:hypothetical protein [Chloroflexota bacterium]
MVSLDDDLRARLQQDPQAIVNLIVRTQQNRDQDLESLRARGLTIRHTYSLISAIAIQGPASAALALTREPWILSIEEDQTVRAV